MLPVSWGPDVLGWVRPTWFEHLTIVGGRLSVCLSEYSWVRQLLALLFSQDSLLFFSLQRAKLVLDLRPLYVLFLLPGTPFSFLYMAGSSLSVKSQRKYHLLRGALPDLSMQSGPFFHFLSYYYCVFVRSSCSEIILFICE